MSLKNLFLVLSLICIFSCSSDDPGDLTSVKACFVAQEGATALTPTLFDAECSTNALSYDWDFGDGSTGTEKNPSHIYASPGTYNVTLTITGADEVTHAVTIAVEVGETPASAITSHFMDINEDEVWEPGIHKITWSISVNDATLTLKPGVIVMFDEETTLGIGTEEGVTNARLIAEGTATQPILFTANSTTPEKGYYFGISFGAGDNGGSSMKYCTVEYGGGSYGTIGELVYINNTEVTLENNIFRQSADKGVALGENGKFTSFTNNIFTSLNGHPLEVYANAVTTIGDNNDYGADKFIRVAGTLDVPTATWKKLEAPYYINSQLHVGSAAGTSLTLSPGTVLKFESVGSMLVGYNGTGTLIAEGTEADSIVFTSGRTSPNKGDWGGVYFLGGNSSSSLKYCKFEYGGQNFSNKLAPVRVESTSVTITNCKFKNSAPYAVWLNDTGHFTSFENNVIDHPGDNGIYINSNYAHTIGTTNTINAAKELTIVGRVTQNVTWPKQSFPYYVIDWMGVGSTEGNVLTISPGVTIRFKKAYSFSLGMYDKAGLIANGTESEPIIFTSDAATPAPKDWEYIYFGPQTMSGTILNYCIIEYAGYNSALGAIHVENTNVPTISNCIVRNSGSYGISLTNATPTLTNNTFENNAGVDTINK